MMAEVFAELARVLKPRGLATVVFHSADAKVWRSLSEAYAAGGFRVEAFVQRCTDPSCFANASIVTSGAGFTRSWAVGDTDLMRMVWNRSANSFAFTVSKIGGSSETVTLGYAVPDGAAAKRWFNDIAVASSMANCTAGAVTAFMDARIDTVRLNSEALAALE